MSEPIYIGNGKEIVTKYGNMLKISFNREDIQKLQDNLNDKGWINLVASKKKTQVDGKPTHSIKIDDWKPEAKPQTPKDVAKDFGADEAPF
jgi:hypothetical protein